MQYIYHIIVLVGIYVILTTSLDLLVGHLGLLSLAHAAFYGIGAYVSALCAVNLGVPFPLPIFLAAGGTAIASLSISLPAAQLKGDYFAIATFGFQMIIYSVINNWSTVTKGPLGISNISRPSLFTVTLSSSLSFAVLTVVVTCIACGVARKLTTGANGRVLHTIRESVALAESLGRDTVRVTITVCAVSAALAGCAGSLYSYYITFIDPSSFTLTESITMLSMVICGGAGSRYGPLVGAVTLILIPELLQIVGLPTSTAANLRQVAYGLILVGVVIHRPEGIAGGVRFGRAW